MSKDLIFNRKFGFEVWDKEKIGQAFSFAKEYKSFISENKTEREVVKAILEIVKKQGFVDIDSKDYTAKKAKKVFRINRGKSLILGISGRKPMRGGIKMILSHIDSPRIDLKPHPLYENEKIAWFKTQYYGGIKKYQWPADLKPVFFLAKTGNNCSRN